MFPRLVVLDGVRVEQMPRGLGGYQAVLRNDTGRQKQSAEEESSSNSSSLSADWKMGQPLAIERQGKSPYTPISDNLKHMITKSPSSSPSRSRKSGRSS